MRLGRNQYEYVCATPEELTFGMARLLTGTGLTMVIALGRGWRPDLQGLGQWVRRR